MIEVHELHLRRGEHTLMTGFSTTFERGKIYALLGPNGSGKSTLLLALAGLLAPQSGSIAVNGSAVAALSPRQRARLISLLPQRDETLFSGTLRELLLLASFDNGAATDAVEPIMARLGLAKLAGRSVNELSGGEYQRALIGLVMLQNSPVILLDEPLRNLDLRYRAIVMDWLRERAGDGALIVVALHELEWVPRFCDSVCLLYDHDNPLCGSLDEVYSRVNLERLMQCSFVELTLHDRTILLPQ